MWRKFFDKFKIKLLRIDPMQLKIMGYVKKGAIIGNNVKLYSELNTNEPYLISIGNDVTVSGGVSFITHDNSIIKMNEDKTLVLGRIKIGNKCFIGYGSIILPGIEIANNVIVGAGSVITKSIMEEGVIIAGNPAKKISTIDEYLNKYYSIAVNTDSMDFETKKHFILANESKLISK
jgi:acetyltransferase-like isoleucine patch superfamily enzyme